jgi:hypothetical protein
MSTLTNKRRRREGEEVRDKREGEEGKGREIPLLEILNVFIGVTDLEIIQQSPKLSWICASE